MLLRSFRSQKIKSSPQSQSREDLLILVDMTQGRSDQLMLESNDPVIYYRFVAGSIIHAAVEDPEVVEEASPEESLQGSVATQSPDAFMNIPIE